MVKVELHGYQYSVYTWIGRLALHEKGIGYQGVEVNPFADDVPAGYLAMHPFRRVPTPAQRARVDHIISVIDNYAYWPLVRQVFSHGVFRPRLGRPSDQSEYQRGLEAAQLVLLALDRLACGGEFLVADSLSLADIHLAPMIGYFTSAPSGEVLLKQHSRLCTWWSAMSLRKAFVETKPVLSEPSA